PPGQLRSISKSASSPLKPRHHDLVARGVCGVHLQPYADTAMAHFPGQRRGRGRPFLARAGQPLLDPNFQNENPPGRATTGAARDLVCPARTNRGFEHKRQFPGLSSPRRFAFRVAPLNALVAEEEVRAPTERQMAWLSSI